MFLRVFRFVWGLYVGAVNGFGVLWIQSAQGLCFGKVGTLVPLESEIGFISLKVSGCTAFMLQALIFIAPPSTRILGGGSGSRIILYIIRGCGGGGGGLIRSRKRPPPTSLPECALDPDM